MSIFIDTSCKKKKSDQLCRKVKGDKNVHTRSTNIMIVEQHEKIVYTKIIQPVELKKSFFTAETKQMILGFQTTLTKRILTKVTRIQRQSKFLRIHNVVILTIVLCLFFFAIFNTKTDTD